MPAAQHAFIEIENGIDLTATGCLLSEARIETTHAHSIHSSFIHIASALSMVMLYDFQLRTGTT